VDEETGSKMDLHNLATVLTPNVLYSKSKDPIKDESFLAIEAVMGLLSYQEDFCMVIPQKRFLTKWLGGRQRGVRYFDKRSHTMPPPFFAFFSCPNRYPRMCPLF
jgi:hypothetical protein